uniref:Uncharacterized protein n=1 Tax=Romanomermis culicivorax TaxID=13658 RepID=A0A915JGV3_ROMCU
MNVISFRRHTKKPTLRKFHVGAKDSQSLTVAGQPTPAVAVTTVGCVFSKALLKIWEKMSLLGVTRFSFPSTFHLADDFKSQVSRSTSDGKTASNSSLHYIIVNNGFAHVTDGCGGLKVLYG